MEPSGKTKKASESYKRIETIGEGAYGKAHLVQCSSDGSYAVIKQVEISKMDEDEKKATLREARILEVLNHPFITKFKEVYRTKRGILCIVMEYCDGGDLAKRIKDRQDKYKTTGVWQYFSEDQVLNWFTQICLGMKHCHDRKILHRDLKA